MAKVVKENVKVLEYELPLRVEALEKGGFLATSRALQGVLAEGDTVSESVANAIDVAANIIDIRGKEGLSIPLKLLKAKKSSKMFVTKVSVQVSY
ncbi:hypothetical protein A2715_00610 [Candidatus Woesebacteria bacterium RIFCSPHIGHO2_01_FULL_39_32]|uniref:Uncharacterized protein n=1 Tax=Candidatus Woesebacteria bacterium RIFCSPLOWO2_01_FULL_39_25 TaxID=1802521 RepID=A0A1F8BI58_9BACT|nr:MAG: hypothetical protein A2124_03410 [Candidatus Woesebacteria bacterium GWB1_37_5]OGM24416.1 MAG: hypothetical protein A2715_00610 [Candidatus Woesebacteria bacterium RIFCSPHIGHO2_01_FULL_39_32]OGM35576.1 MAG: hypothetical protein A3F01_02660 [Candidatus Woesebacteria bacterium RIFCSPHIGHO2_12_FULL_38_11]OGM63723.1 MAG: hypothetical protein A2893_01950 [Candidatus Woesebacteria bacterium RIFCSPLOWO2_01_FULL_39_25]